MCAPPVGTRIEETPSAMFGHIEQQHSSDYSACGIELVSIVDNIGLPVSAASTRVYSNNSAPDRLPQDGDILVTLSLNEKHHPTADYVRKSLREKSALPESFPGSTFSFLPADIISQILNFGSPAPHRPAGHRAGPEGGPGLCRLELLRRTAHHPWRRRPAACSSLSTIRN